MLRNTYALLSMTLLFSAAVAAASVAFQWPAPGILLTLGGYFGLLFAVYKFKNSGWALPAVFALTGFMGYSLGPVLAKSLALPGGAQVVTLALAATGATFLALSVVIVAFAVVSRSCRLKLILPVKNAKKRSKARSWPKKKGFSPGWCAASRIGRSRA